MDNVLSKTNSDEKLSLSDDDCQCKKIYCKIVFMTLLGLWLLTECLLHAWAVSATMQWYVLKVPAACRLNETEINHGPWCIEWLNKWLKPHNYNSASKVNKRYIITLICLSFIMCRSSIFLCFYAMLVPLYSTFVRLRHHILRSPSFSVVKWISQGRMNPNLR